MSLGVCSGSPMSGGARTRLLRAADELFYAEGINSVGIHRVIEHAGVAKASLYACFGSKNQLIRAYLLQRYELRRSRIEHHQSQGLGPRDRMLAVFEALQEAVDDAGWRGCAFISAAGEARTDSTVREIAAMARTHLRQGIMAQAQALQVADAEGLADQIVLLHAGALVAAHMGVDPAAPGRARAIAEVMIDQAERGGSSRR